MRLRWPDEAPSAPSRPKRWRCGSRSVVILDVGKPETHAGYRMPGVPPKEMSLSYDTGAYPTRQRPTGFKILGRKLPPLPR
jgi:hypothetical protein